MVVYTFSEYLNVCFACHLGLKRGEKKEQKKLGIKYKVLYSKSAINWIIKGIRSAKVGTGCIQ